MRAVIVRHGNTFEPGDPPRRIGARTDLSLVESGKAQAAALAACFAETEFHRCLVSPLRRTRETAAIIAPNLPLEKAPWLCEIDHGPDEGATEAAVQARLGTEALASWEKYAAPPPGWVVDAPARIAAWRSFFAEARGTILLVTSNGAARFALAALRLPPARLRTGAYGEIISGRVTAWDVRP
ncbi:histidine phosphatase family protein [Sphingomonas mucosissima]|uniref:2,3-bisphosphoglycerate-dependent phosphoglycerate mutase n=1 Tax=Sphingomonas mucosissima TaxID=370959 RepID=A0A245ZT57_9SPHN|nr:histidine phosphatase family protein [Sphingomonas mucosissima]OWK32943.1 2,3-bisphosphoglycerate-dependent phosphoglycerate mutase [Sphingomonas mucosissima]